MAATTDASWHGRMYAFYPNGTLKWAYNPGTSGCWIASSPAITDDGEILFGDYTNPKGIFRALYPNKTVHWQITIPCPYGEIDISSSPAIDSDGMIYFGGHNANRELWALYPNGTIAWSYLTGGAVPSSPAIGKDRTIYVGSCDNKLHAINKNGTSKWTYTTGGDIYSSPAIGADGTIYVGSNDGKVYAVNPDGTPKWNYTTGGAIYSSPAIGSDGTIYVGSGDGKLYAIGPTHDVAVTNVTPSKTVVGQGYSMSINVTVENQGTYAENLNVTTYYNATIPNGDFEKDPVGTSYNDITDWNYNVIVHKGNPPTGDDLQIVDDYYFKGDKSLYSYLKTTSVAPFPGDSIVSQDISMEKPVFTTADYITLWIGGDGYTTSSRYSWWIELILADGTNTYNEKLRCDCWGNNEGCNPNHFNCYNATETGADGNTWKRYTRRIPDSLDESNLTVTIRHRQASWDLTTASSWYRLDSIYFSDSEGNPHDHYAFIPIETKTVTNLPPGEETTLTFTWNTIGVAKGNYTITAYAHPVPEETDTTDNTLFADECVCVSIPGDVDCDRDVDLFDAVKLLLIYGVKKDNPRYDPNCDIDGDGDIDLFDAVILLTHYGQKDP